MTQIQNAFQQTREVGQLDQQIPGTTLNCEISLSEGGTLIAGQAVKLEDSAGGVPKVLALAANTDKSFGFITYNLKDKSFVAGSPCVIAIAGTVMAMKAGAAIARGANVEVVYTTQKVITSASINPRVGWAYDKAAVDGDIIRVFITTPTFAQNSMSLNDLIDVTIATPTDGQVLKYTGGIWSNQADAT